MAGLAPPKRKRGRPKKERPEEGLQLQDELEANTRVRPRHEIW